MMEWVNGNGFLYSSLEALGALCRFRKIDDISGFSFFFWVDPSISPPFPSSYAIICVKGERSK